MQNTAIQKAKNYLAALNNGDLVLSLVSQDGKSHVTSIPAQEINNIQNNIETLRQGLNPEMPVKEVACLRVQIEKPQSYQPDAPPMALIEALLKLNPANGNAAVFLADENGNLTTRSLKTML